MTPTTVPGSEPGPLAPGTVLPEVRQTISQARIEAYARASGDHNPIHLDETYARAAGLPGTIAHGMLSLGVLASSVEGWVAGRGRLARLHCRFAGMVRPGDVLVCRGRVGPPSSDPGRVHLELEAITAAGVRALTHASATIEMDRPLGPETGAAPGVARDGD
ncbi:MAG TPA: MaoC family dehydratase [Verrucomicrobiae bacterium]|nr:MaoC family dehydratase [Verrucomicrobiae bacterium]